MKQYDLLVVGGGQAGCAAALAGARKGLRVLLAEASGSLGGSATVCLVNPYMPYTTVVEEDGKERRLELSAGIFREIHEELNRDEIYGYKGKGPDFHEETMKVLYDRKMQEAGVEVLFHATLCGAETEGRRIQSVTFATVGGLYTFTADTYVDATGDATLSVMSGCSCRLGRPKDSLCQPMTLCFRIGNIDMESYKKHHAEISPLYKKLQAEGKLKNPREDVLIFPTRIPGVLHFNTTRVVRLNPTDPFDVSRAEREAREQVVEMVAFLRENFEAFAHADLLMTAASIGVRESRMLNARYVVTGEELLAGTHYEDGIAAGNYDIDIHSPDGTGTSHHYFPKGVYYTIPYRSMLPQELDNLLVAGRSIGATHEAQASIRIMPICTCLGEAAGVAAAVAHQDGVDVADASAEKIRTLLREAGAFVG